ncbi:MAG: hypothetical protein A2301_03765 [Candidatus Magasanikbacteria bacterium RIFOXYB2_FULL_40_13]|nr:MAG: hypothetical protein A2301_03765 [Candidatus Magasanikbacteria bacterium RIFOXYB2_FULL_40_13]
MSNTKSPEYEKAETYTRLSVPPGAPKVILPKQMDEIVSIPLGFCPLGISNYGGLQFLVAHYWSPAILAVKFSELPDGGGLELVRKDCINWVELEDGSGKVRIFPEMTPGSDGKRIQCALLSPNGEIWATRNGERDHIWRLASDHKGGWRLLSPLKVRGVGYIESMAMLDDHLLVLRSKQDGTDVWVENYDTDTLDTNNLFLTDIYHDDVVPQSPWIYGIGVKDGELYFITSISNNVIPRGIYHYDELVVPGVWGTGLVFAADGSAIVTQYNADAGPLGEPSAIVRVPAGAFLP